MKFGIVLAMTMTLLNCVDVVRADDSLQGSWTLVRGEANGKPLTEQQLKGAKLVIQGDRYSVTLEGNAPITGVQTLGATSSIKTIDITDSNGSHKDQTCLGIYKVTDGEFHVAFSSPGKPRPKAFTSTPDSGEWVHVWKRATK